MPSAISSASPQLPSISPLELSLLASCTLTELELLPLIGHQSSLT
jgi:hypothetical protein